MRVHFQDSHFLCEEGDCKDEKFTRVFRTDIDLRGHRAQVHSHSLGKAAAKQARTLELEFTLAPRSMESKGRIQRNQRCATRNHNGETSVISGEDRASRYAGSAANIRDPEQFPSLTADQMLSVIPGSDNSQSLAQKLSKGNRFTVRNGSQTNEEFPSLIVQTSPSSDINGTKNRPESLGKRSVHLQLSSQENLESSKTRKSTSNVSIQLTQTRPHKSQNTEPQQAEARVMRVKSTSNIRIQSCLNVPFDDFPSLVPTSKIQQSTQPIIQQQHVPQQVNWSKKEAGKMNKNVSIKNQPSINTYRALNTDNFPVLEASATKLTSSPSSVALHSASADAPLWVSVKNKTAQITSFNGKKGTSPVSSSGTNLVASSSEPIKMRGKKKKIYKLPHDLECLPADRSRINYLDEAERKVSALQIGDLKGLSTYTGSALNLIGMDNVSSSEVVPSKLNLINPPECKPIQDSGAKPKTKPPKLSQENFPSIGQLATPSLERNAGTSPLVSSGSVRPPPGFNVEVPTPTKVTFTSSSGRSFPISVGKSSNYNYLQPPDFAARNKALITTITDLLGEQQDRFNQFRVLSTQFRTAIVKPEHYYSSCIDIIGYDCFLALFPELLVLLPDIDKQQQLLKVHRCEMRIDGAGTTFSAEPYVVCATCKQVLSPSDLKHHLSSHSLETHFPALSAGVDSNLAWVKP